MKFRSLLSCLALLALTCGGCVGTSKPAQYGLHESIPLVCARTVAYATAASDAASLNAANALSAVVSDVNAIDVDVVAGKWPPVKAPYLDFIAKDARYQETDRARMRTTVIKIDALIANEQLRRSKVMSLGGGFGLIPAIPTSTPPAGRP